MKTTKQTAKPKSPPLRPSDAAALVIKAACDWAEREWDGDLEGAAEDLVNAVDEYRRSQRAHAGKTGLEDLP